MLAGATVVNEDLGDDLDVINPDFLGTCWKSITNDTETILQVDTSTDEILKIYKIDEERPKLDSFKNNVKTPSGEPSLGSGNFTVKK